MRDHFEQILGLGNATDNPNDLFAYSYDASELSGTCRAVLFPSSDEHLRQILTYCGRINVDVVVRGNGSNTSGQTIPANSVVVCTQNLNRIHALNTNEGWVQVDCGVTIGILNDALNQHDVVFPLQGASDNLTTIGALLATNAPSRYSGRYGLPSERLVELECMDGTGKHYTFTRDFEQYCGNEGSVFILIKAKLKTVQRAERSASLEYFDKPHQALERSHALRNDPDIIAVDYFDVAAATYCGLNTKHTLFIEHAGGAGTHLHEDYKRLLQKRYQARRLLGAKGHTKRADGRAHNEQLLDAIEWCIERDTPVICHLQTGVIHPFFKREKEQLFNDWAEYLAAMGASPVGQHGYGLVHKKHVPPGLKTKIRQLKERYDYSNTLGKGKLYDYI